MPVGTLLSRSTRVRQDLQHVQVSGVRILEPEGAEQTRMPPRGESLCVPGGPHSPWGQDFWG